MRQPAGWRSRPSTIRSRIGSILAVPLIGILVLLGNLVYAEIGERTAAGLVTSSTTIGMAAQDLAYELQNERGMTMGVLAGAPDDREELNRLRPHVDQRRAALSAALGTGAQTHASAKAALAQLDGLAALRAQVDSGRIERSAAFQYFADRIAAFNDVDLGIDEPSPNPDPVLRRGLAAFAALGTAREAVAGEAALMVGTLTTGKFTKDEYTQFSAARVTRQQALTEFTRYATPAQRAEADAAAQSPEATAGIKYEQMMLPAADGRRIDLDEETFWQAMSGYSEKLRAAQDSLGTTIVQRTGHLRDEAAKDLMMLVPIAIIAVIMVFALVRFATVSIVRPLTALVAETDAVAGQRLPQAVALVQTGAQVTEPPAEVRPLAGATREIVSVATSVNRMQRTAYQLATEQATLRRTTVDSLANLGRRTQNLLRRQLSFISQLEREEGDPEALANLFELDHLATRLRRNAESLLVLVGEQTPRRWSAPLPVADVVRAAVAEVEEYRRVALRRIDPAHLGGGYVTDVAHLIAELVENGLTFSPPDQDVEIHGRLIGSGYLIAIVDHGIGMDPADLARANARLRGEERFTIAPTRFLGHYVVGELANTLGIEVQVVQSPVTGVTARILLPNELLTGTTALDSTSAPAADPGGTPALDAGPARQSQRDDGPGQQSRQPSVAATAASPNGPASNGPALSRPALNGPALSRPALNASSSTGPASTGPASTGPKPMLEHWPAPPDWPVRGPVPEPVANQDAHQGFFGFEPARHRTCTDGTGADRSGANRTSADRTGTDRNGTDRNGTNGTNGTSVNRTSVNRTSTDRSATERPAARPVTDRPDPTVAPVPPVHTGPIMPPAPAPARQTIETPSHYQDGGREWIELPTASFAQFSPSEAVVAAEDPTSFDRTRNGLPKRLSRPRTVRSSQPEDSKSADALRLPTQRPGANGSARQPTSEPAAVRSMLTALRDGVSRGQGTAAAEHGRTTGVDDRTTGKGTT